MDWNKDQKVDLLTGEYEGQIRIYLNTGTAQEPVFESFSYLQVGGADFDCGETSKPDVVDWDSDGRKDLLVGVDGGNVLLLRNTGTDAAPEFASVAYVQAGGGNLNVAAGRASPVAVDWNRDGKKDLIVGETEGTLHYYENIGTDAEPVFGGDVLLAAGGQTIDVELWSRPEPVDWDNDGVMDLLCGSYDSLAIPTSPVWYFHSDPGPVQLTAPAGLAEIVRGEDCTIEWSGGNIYNALRLLRVGPTGWHELVAEAAANDQQFPWGTATAPVGWYTFAAFVKTEATWAQTPISSPGWAHVVEAAASPSSAATLAVPVGLDSGFPGTGDDAGPPADDAEPQAEARSTPVVSLQGTDALALEAPERAIPSTADPAGTRSAAAPSIDRHSPAEAVVGDEDAWGSALGADWLDVL